MTKRPNPQLIYQTLEEAVAAMPRLPLPQAVIDHKAKVAEYEAKLADNNRKALLDKVIRKAYLKRQRNLRYKAKAKALPIKPMKDYGDI